MLGEVLVVVGAGGMGLATTRRIGSGRTVLLADFDESTLETVSAELRNAGMRVHVQAVDVSSRESVRALARTAASLGPVRHVVHTAGLSPVQAPVEAILRVDLLGTALVLEEFGEVITVGGAGVMISSMSGHLSSPPAPEVEVRLARTPADALLDQPEAAVSAFADSGHAYSFAKRANQLRVRAASTAWGARGARVNSVSPGVISTGMGRQELAGSSGATMRALVEGSGTGRLGSPDDIAAAVDFLLSDAASFITGTDLLVDGGVVAAASTGDINLAGEH